MTVLQSETDGVIQGAGLHPIVVDLDHTFLKVDTLYELFATGLFTKPLATLLSLLALRDGIAAFKARLASLARLDPSVLPVRGELFDYLAEQKAHGRDIHLATAADRSIAEGVARHHPIFKSVQATENSENLKGAAKARKLAALFPDGFVYAGDSFADLPVWRAARAAIVVSDNRSLGDAVAATGVPVEKTFDDKSPRASAWIRAFRPHQWAKNAIVFVPLALGWHDITPAGFVKTVIFTALLCAVASLTYLVNDMADLAADRKHWSKRRRPFASGALPVRDGLLVVGVALPILLALSFLISPLGGVCLLCYVVVTLGYSFGWKRVPIFDTFIISLLFTIRVLIGIAVARLQPSAWLLTFSMFFFFSLALAKRHTEILRAAEHKAGKLEGRGYQLNDAGLTMNFGISASMASIVIVVIYLVEDVFSRHFYSTPAWLWVAPIAIFLFTCRIWTLSHRGRMTDDPVAFALRDRLSLGLGLCVAVSLLLAI